MPKAYYSKRAQKATDVRYNKYFIISYILIYSYNI